MCQVEEEDLEKVAASEALAIPGESLKISDISERPCIKCGAPAAIHLRDEDFKCGACLVASVNQKFRIVLAKYKISSSKERVLVAFSGGPASSALLGTLRHATSGSIYSRLFLVPVILYIDEGASFELPLEERKKHLTSVMEAADSSGSAWLLLHSSLEMVFSSEPMQLTSEFVGGTALDVHTDTHCIERLGKLMRSVKTQTGKEEIAKLLRTTLMRKIARQLSISTLFLGDSVDRLAVQLITNTALGKGKRLPLDLGYLDAHDPICTIVRPLKDVTKKEIAMFNAVSEIRSVEVPVIQSVGDTRASVYSFTEKFVFDLQAGFPQTVTTLCKTGDKLCSVTAGKIGKKAEDDFCEFCLGPMDSSEKDSCTAENSIALSLRLSALLKKGPVDLEDVMSERRSGISSCGSKDVGCGDTETGGCCQSKEKKQPECDRLCYSCRWMMAELGDRTLLPDDLASELDQRGRRNKMRESIKEFLL
ncbi:Cytoplasmic tRNA 2-thiolation protein 2 [Hypsibius exemplaris]|uniref:Cytoplasmic tRNA 2-thiolation protein 2 n=1 Tax=Hypsibius exemplaris TaxID=2072580 RepID=A0A1W0W9H7_HYPEX|nr:Cytoplasmic tRNA 2-thiolation protein 2 [Hypsibius exemplaris]